MLCFINQFFTRSQTAAKRLSSLLLAVFMLQMIAAGLCAPLLSASPVQTSASMQHCMDDGLSMMDETMADDSMQIAACVHCDIPDISIFMDKHSFGAADFNADLFVLAVMPTSSDVAVPSLVAFPPVVSALRHSLSSFHLNARFRI